MTPRLINGRYALSGEPIEGGAARVFKASDTRSDLRLVALKIFTERHDTRLAGEFFARECRALQELTHPAIIELLDWGIVEESGERFLVLEWMPTTLADRRVHGFEGWDSYYDEIGRSVLDALAFAHGREVWHRDLKPQNVLIDEAGRPRLADFSIAKVGDRYDPTRTVGDFGSRPFTPCEPDDGLFSGGRDCWSYAAISLYCLVDHDFADKADLFRALEVADIPQDVATVFERCLSTVPAERPAHAVLLQAELERIQIARERSSIRRRRIHLDLTSACVAQLRELIGVSSRGEAQRVIAADLRGGAAFRPFYARPTPDPVPDHFQLLGTEYSYHVAVDEERRDRLSIIGLREGSVVALEQQRERSFQPNVDFEFGEPHRQLTARQSLQELIEEYQEFRTSQARERSEQEARELFRTWRAQLQLKSDVELMLSKPLRYQSQTAEGRRVVFQMQSDPAEVEVGEVRVISNQEGLRLRGEVEEVAGRRLTLYLTDGIPDDVPDRGELRLDTVAARTAVDRQKNALDAVQYRRAVRGDLGRLLVEPEYVRQGVAEEAIAFLNPRLDDAKRVAVSRALASPDLHVVVGPPGTGKTTFIGELVLQALRREHGTRILIASQTHVALDNALELIGKADPPPRILRIGRTETGKVGAGAEQWLVENQLKAWRGRVVERSRRFLDAWASARGISTKDIGTAGLFEELASVQTQIRDLAGRRAELEQLVSRLGAAPLPDSDDESPSPTELEGQTKQVEVTDQLDELVGRMRELEAERRVVIERLVQRKAARDAKTLRDLSPEEARARADELLPGATPETEMLRRLLAIQGDWHQRFGRSGEFAAALIARADVVGGTCLGFAGSPGTSDISFDLCILDEASRATPTEALVPMSRSRRWVLVGDPRQLPPFVDRVEGDAVDLSDYDLSMELLERSLLDRLIELLPEESVSTLTVQHRMAPAIGRLVSDCFYEGALTHARTDADDNPFALAVPKRVTWFTTSGLADAREQKVGTSYKNLAEIRVVRSLLKRLQWVAEGLRRDLVVVLLAGYAEQCDQLSRTLAALAVECDRLSIEVHTVDSFQGREADVAIYSVTRSNPERRLGFLGDLRRLSVALSRGKELLVIVGDSAFCREAQGENPLKPVLEYIERTTDDCAVVEAE